jgi:hypothetical protein
LATKWADGAAGKVVESAGKENFAGKVVIDVTNPIIFTKENASPELALGYPDSAESWGFINNHWTHGFALLKK